MRVLTVRQPWAWAIIHGGKNVENRGTGIVGAYRGPVAIHVSKAAVGSEDVAALRKIAGRDAWTVGRGGWLAAHGRVIGVVDLVDEHLGWMEPRGKPCSPWGVDYVGHVGQRHLVLENPRPITPIPTKGRLGLWTPDTALADQIRHALEEDAA